MEIESEPYESLMADYDEESNEECWSSSIMTFMALYLQDLQGMLICCVLSHTPRFTPCRGCPSPEAQRQARPAALFCSIRANTSAIGVVAAGSAAK